MPISPSTTMIALAERRLEDTITIREPLTDLHDVDPDTGKPISTRRPGSFSTGGTTPRPIRCSMSGCMGAGAAARREDPGCAALRFGVFDLLIGFLEVAIFSLPKLHGRVDSLGGRFAGARYETLCRNRLTLSAPSGRYAGRSANSSISLYAKSCSGRGNSASKHALTL